MHVSSIFTLVSVCMNMATFITQLPFPNFPNSLTSSLSLLIATAPRLSDYITTQHGAHPLTLPAFSASRLSRSSSLSTKSVR